MICLCLPGRQIGDIPEYKLVHSKINFEDNLSCTVYCVNISFAHRGTMWNSLQYLPAMVNVASYTEHQLKINLVYKLRATFSSVITLIGGKDTTKTWMGEGEEQGAGSKEHRQANSSKSIGSLHFCRYCAPNSHKCLLSSHFAEVRRHHYSKPCSLYNNEHWIVFLNYTGDIPTWRREGRI